MYILSKIDVKCPYCNMELSVEGVPYITYVCKYNPSDYHNVATHLFFIQNGNWQLYFYDNRFYYKIEYVKDFNQNIIYSKKEKVIIKACEIKDAYNILTKYNNLVAFS